MQNRLPESIVRGWLLLACLIASPLSFADQQLETDRSFSPDELVALNLVEQFCVRLQTTGDAFTPPQLQEGEMFESTVDFRGSIVGTRYVYQMSSEDSIRVDLIDQGDQPPRLVVETQQAGKPLLFVGTDLTCTINQIKRLVYKNDETNPQAEAIESLTADGQIVGNELLDAAVPDAITGDHNKDPVVVALVDSGVNYLLPEIAAGLARYSDGRLAGYDFWDMDQTPFDAHIAASPFFVQRHGTRTASLLLRDAGEGVRLVSYRYPRPDMTRMAALIEHADGLGVRVIGLPLGSNKKLDWVEFEHAARVHPQILFVVSAGNGGRDIDQELVYPAALDLQNMIVVTSADDSTGLAERVNRGAKSVDYLLPAEHQLVLDYSGEQTSASGSSYAVSRMVAMAARLLKQAPDLDTDGIISAIEQYLLPAPQNDIVARGYIADPRAPGQQVSFENDGPVKSPEQSILSDNNKYRFKLDLIYLDPRWHKQDVKKAIDTASGILGQCGITILPANSYSLTGPDYLRDLETGIARTLLKAFSSQTKSTAIRLVLARDTHMAVQYEAEAFGRGNTTGRRWLNGSLWVMYGAPDLSITLAHELFHILANDGSHSNANENLMSANTSGNNTALTRSQCQAVRSYIDFSGNAICR